MGMCDMTTEDNIRYVLLIFSLLWLAGCLLWTLSRRHSARPLGPRKTHNSNTPRPPGYTEREENQIVDTGGDENGDV